MWIAIITIVLAVCLVVGPIMTIMPSKSQARLAKIRSVAATLGFRVRLVTRQEETEQHGLAAYSLSWPENFQLENRQVTNWKLIDTNMNHEIHFHGTWDWEKNRIAPKWSQEMIKDMVAAKPEGIFEIGANSAGIECVWNERLIGRDHEEVVKQLFVWLSGVRDNYVDKFEIERVQN